MGNITVFRSFPHQATSSTFYPTCLADATPPSLSLLCMKRMRIDQLSKEYKASSTYSRLTHSNPVGSKADWTFL